MENLKPSCCLDWNGTTTKFKVVRCPKGLSRRSLLPTPWFGRRLPLKLKTSSACILRSDIPSIFLRLEKDKKSSPRLRLPKNDLLARSEKELVGKRRQSEGFEMN
jgi:hypothetical protein